MTNSSKPNSGKESKVRVRHDTGLSAKERTFVHALRSLFDPKGKTRASDVKTEKSCSAGESTEKKTTRSGSTRATQRGQTVDTKLRATQTRPAHLPPADTMTKWVHPARLRIRKGNKEKEAASGMKKVLATAKKQTTTKLSPSAKNRAEKRVNKQRQWAQDKSNSQAERLGQLHLLEHTPIPLPEKETKKQKKTDKQVRKPTLMDVLPKGTPELEVIEAWGGANALLMLSKYQKKTSPYPKSQKTYSVALQTHYRDPSASEARDGYMGIMFKEISAIIRYRDYNKSSSGQIPSEMRKLKSSGLHDFKKLESLVVQKAKLKATKRVEVKTSVRKETSHSRRLERRRQLRLRTEAKPEEPPRVVKKEEAEVKGKEKEKEVEKPRVAAKSPTWNIPTPMYKELIAEMREFQIAFDKARGSRPDVVKLRGASVERLMKLLFRIESSELEFVLALPMELQFDYKPKFIRDETGG
jgi:hypothetical protein